MFHEGAVLMSREGTDLTRAEFRSSEGQKDIYRDCETAPDYERALLECASGSHSAVGEIYVREKEQLRAVAHRIVHDISREEDVIHEALVQIIRYFKDFDP